MTSHPWRWLRLALLTSLGLLVATLPPLAQADRVVPIPLAVPAGGPHFLYVDDGDAQQDGIDGYQMTRQGLVLTPGSPYPTSGYGGSGAFGINVIALSTAYGACLYHSDAQPGGLSGQVESFTVNRTTGVLTEVSIIRLPGTYTMAGDIHAAADGHEVYVATFPVLLGHYSLDVLTVAPGCALKLATSVLPAHGYYTLALVGRDGLLGVATEYDRLDLYRISHGTQLTLVSSTPSQVLLPMGAAVGQVGGKTDTFNGIGTTGTSEVEAHTVSGQGVLGDVPGSPAVDSQGTWGAWVWFDPLHQQVLESESGSNTLGFYGAKGGALTLLGRAPVVGGGPELMIQLGRLLFVENGWLDVCLLRLGAATCHLAGTLPGGAAGWGLGVL
jgi:hypothetical protein